MHPLIDDHPIEPIITEMIEVNITETAKTRLTSFSENNGQKLFRILFCGLG